MALGDKVGRIRLQNIVRVSHGIDWVWIIDTKVWAVTLTDSVRVRRPAQLSQLNLQAFSPAGISRLQSSWRRLHISMVWSTRSWEALGQA